MAEYKIVRFYFRGGSQGNDSRPSKRTINTGLTLEQAQAHCNDPNSSSRTATSSAAKAITRRNGPWFDGYTQER